jgi:hypothetical protein
MYCVYNVYMYVCVCVFQFALLDPCYFCCLLALKKQTVHNVTVQRLRPYQAPKDYNDTLYFTTRPWCVPSHPVACRAGLLSGSGHVQSAACTIRRQQETCTTVDLR